MKLLISIAVCCITFINAQNSFPTQNPYYNEQISEDRLYFEDNKPSGSNRRAVNDVNQNTNLRQPAQAPAIREQAIARGQHFIPEPSVSLQAPYENIRGNLNPQVTQRLAPVDVAQVTETPIITRFDNVSLAVTNFGLNLMKSINEIHRGNLVISPYSIATLLGLLQQGASGGTLEQISQALQMTPELSAAAYEKMSNNLQSRSSRNILRVANNVFVADAFEINPNFKRIAQRNFGSEVTPTSFANPERASQKINNWVAMKTNNKIEKLIPSDALDVTSQIVLVNTVYFKGIWEFKFKPESTVQREFQLSSGAPKLTPFMRMRRSFRTGTDRSNQAQVLILPFETDQYSLMVILPSKTSNLAALIPTLTNIKLAKYHTFSTKEVELDLPKFTVRADTDLAVVFRKMGIENIFSQYSELFGLGTYQTHSPQVSTAVHSAMLSINEEGGIAAAATAVAVVALSYDDPSVTFDANRPFLTVLWDNNAALPLFMAKIEDPVL